MARRSAREAAMSLLYQRNYIQDYDLNALGDMVEEWDLDDKDIPYIDDILTGSLRHINEIDDLIRSNAKGWKFERISKVDLSILRLALYEILYRDDIPESVSINGILGTVVRSQENSSDT